MTAKDVEQISNIVVDMLVEFQEERNRLQNIYDNGLSRIHEIEEDIINYRDSEDVEFKVFSPRNISTLNEDKLLSMDREKTEIELSNKELLHQIKYYSEKIDNLRIIKSVIDGEVLELENELYSSDESEEYDPIKELYGDKNKSFKKYLSDKKTELLNQSSSSSDKSDSTESKGSYIPKSESSSLGLNDYDKNSLIDDLSRISHRIEIGSKVIDNDVFRTKMELKNIKNNLDVIIDSIK